MVTWVFVDLDQCARDVARVDPSSCRVVAYCGRAYSGPVPPHPGETMRSCSLAREAADALFHYDLGKRVQAGSVRAPDRVVIVSKDASWYNAEPHLRGEGLQDILICSGARDLPQDLVSPVADVCMGGVGAPKSEKAFHNFVMNNVPPDKRGELLEKIRPTSKCQGPT
eukprot:jgi/Mesvir1/24136/Mv10853-RA.1